MGDLHFPIQRTFRKGSDQRWWSSSLVRIILLCLSITTTITQGFVTNPDQKAFTPHTLLHETVATQNGNVIELGRERLQHYFNFPLDDWQLQAGGEIVLGRNVIVSAPTGAGKSVVGEMALHVAVEDDYHAIYTSPLKALSNQKFTELRHIFGKAQVGLSTGDMSINRGAQVTVMTTEVYRNIAWRATGRRHQGDSTLLLEDELLSRDDLENNKAVVLDEFHYMGQPGRGGVWEECVITSPAHTQIVGLSATLPNAAQLASWMEGVTGRTTVLIEAKGGRPVPLRYLFATREGLYPLFRNPDAGPGAPLGLLGLRGDGVVPSRKKTQRGFSLSEIEEYQEDSVATKIPRGLKTNPELKRAAERRIQRVNRAIDRQKVRQTLRKGQEDWDPLERPRRRNVVQRQMSAKEERQQRERLLRSEMRKAVPSLPVLLKRLEQRGLLPAIFFIFSRAGCDEAAEMVCNFARGPREIVDIDLDEESSSTDRKTKEQPRRKRKTRQRGNRYMDENEGLVKDSSGRSFRKGSNYVSDDVLASVFEHEYTRREIDSFEVGSPLSQANWNFYAKAGLLSLAEVEEVANRVAIFNQKNEEIAFNDAAIERFLFGVGSHHAGMLAAHKAFVETLYRAQLMKAVFATETLAAGINMPARTTVICALAKRGDGRSMQLLETSNLLQMAGRAGRRGMDTDGTCVIMATAFEGHEDAASILTNEIKPIASQFCPSYALAVNLIARGEGKLDVARQLVQKSFAMWEKRQIEHSISATVVEHGQQAAEVVEIASQERFMSTLMAQFQSLVEQRSAKFDIGRIQCFLDILQDREALKKASKSYIALDKMLDLERTTLQYLQQEKDAMSEVSLEDEDDLLVDLLAEDTSAIQKQIDTQLQRFLKTERELSKHPFAAMANVANEIMRDGFPESKALLACLEGIHAASDETFENGVPLTAEELCSFSKSLVVMKRKTRKLQTAIPDIDSDALLEQVVDRAEAIQEDTWQDMLALTRVLVSYGCLSTNASLDESDAALEEQEYHVTPAGVNIGMIGFENALWCLVAIGGAWDVYLSSSKLDSFRSAMDALDRDGNYDFFDSDPEVKSENKGSGIQVPEAQQEAETLVEQLRSLTPSEMAGYISCLVAENYRGSSNVIENFQKLSPRQQRVIQSSLMVLERLMEVQKEFSVDESSRQCNLELSSCEVVTAWAAGCTWNEALEISGAAPGDLVRTLSRALDALRQYASLPFIPIRASDMDGDEARTISPGIHPDVRRICRQAAQALNRYPVKDPLPFDTEEDEVEYALDEEVDDEHDVEIADDTTE